MNTYVLLHFKHENDITIEISLFIEQQAADK